MASSETPKRRKTKIKIRRKKGDGPGTKSTNNNNNNTTESELLLQQQAVLDLIRNQALGVIAAGDDGKNGSSEEQMKAVNAGYRFLWSYGFDRDEMKKGWRALSEWRA